MIIFKKIRFRNFLSYGNQFSEIALNKKHTTILVGESGCGKSSIQDALFFALFGKAFRDVKKGELINEINNAECLVELEFSVGKNEYLIRRGQKPAVFEIFANGVLLNQDSHTADYQAYLEENILKLNPKTFAQIVVLGYSGFTPFMKLKPAERRQIVEDLLDIQIFSSMSTILAEELKEIKKAISDMCLALGAVNDKIGLYEKFIAEKKRDKQNQIDKLQATVDSELATITQNETDVLAKDAKIVELRATVTDEDAVNNKIVTFNNYQRDIDNKLRDVRKKLRFYQNSEVCHECERPMDDTYRNSMIAGRVQREAELMEGSKKVSEGVKKWLARKSEIDKIKNQISNMESESRTLKGRISVKKQYIVKERAEIETLKNRSTDATEEEAALKDLNVQRVDIETKRGALSEDKLIHEMAINLLQDGGIKAKIIKQYIPVINKTINKFLDFMNLYVKFSIDENFDETIQTRGKGSRSYSSFSDGERQRLDIAILLTWRAIATMKSSLQTNLLFVDELLDSCLDLLATENIVDLLNNEPSLKNMNIIVISHKTSMIDRYSDSIRIEKVKNFSRVVV